jgi:predicted DNA-binding WGR domain protein
MECTTDNHYKFYEMTIEKPDHNVWTARYGPIGKSGTTKTYSRKKWDEILKEKLEKGYVMEEATTFGSVSVTVTNPTPAPAPAPLEEPSVMDNPGKFSDFEIHMYIDRHIDIKEYPFAPRLTQLSQAMSMVWASKPDKEKTEMAIDLFEVRKRYWQTRKLSVEDMKLLNNIYEWLES